MKFSGLKYSTLLTAVLLMAVFAPLGAMPKYVPGQILIKTSAPLSQRKQDWAFGARQLSQRAGR